VQGAWRAPLAGRMAQTCASPRVVSIGIGIGDVANKSTTVHGKSAGSSPKMSKGPSDRCICSGWASPMMRHGGVEPPCRYVGSGVNDACRCRERRVRG
jgi:hypothetical protein